MMGPVKTMLAALGAAALLCGCATGNRVLSLNGRTEYAHLPDQPVLRLSQGDFSLTAWIFLPAIGENNHCILSKRGSGNNNGWTFYVAGKTWPVLAQKVMFHASQGDNPFTVSKTSLNPGEWYHVGVTYQASARRMVLYIDGKEDAVGEGMTPPNPITNISLYLGRDSVYPRYFFGGMMDDVAIWQRALTAFEVQTVMATDLTGRESGLLALWNFDGANLKDRTGRGFDAQMVNLDALP